MECKISHVNPRSQAAFTLVEVMVAAGLSLVIGAAVSLLAYYSSRSFLAMANYTEMGQLSRLALDNMSREIRQARQLTAYSTNSLTFQDMDGNSLRFTYDPATRSLVRVGNGITTQYLTDCDALNFWIYQNTVKSNSFDCESATYFTDARVIQVTWRCSRTIRGMKATTESVQTAKIALRNR